LTSQIGMIEAASVGVKNQQSVWNWFNGAYLPIIET
jgi:hypothetical protein